MPHTSILFGRLGARLVRGAQQLLGDIDPHRLLARRPIARRKVTGGRKDRWHVLRQRSPVEPSGVQRPARVSTQILGWFPDNWTTDRVRWVHQQCTGGTLRVVVLTDPRLFHGIQQHVAVGGTTAPQDVLVPMNGSPRTIVAPLTPKNGTCVVTLHVTPSRIPAHYPSLHNGDTRLLGVHAASFTYRP